MPALTNRDLPALYEAYKRLLTPLDYPNTVTWRIAVCQAVMHATGTDRAAVLLNAPDGPGFAAIGWEHRPTLDAYVSSFHQRSAGDQRRLDLGLRAWARSRVIARAEFEKSEYFNEWCRPTGHLDSAGMCAPLGRPDGEECVMYISAPQPGTFAPDGREVEVLGFLQPALLAGTRAALLGPRLRQDWSNALDALPTPAILIGISGAVIHANPGATGLLAAEPDQRALVTYVRRWAREFRRVDGLPPRAWSKVSGQRDSYILRATLLEEGPLVGCEPAVMFTIERTTPPRRLAITGLQARFHLTPREVEVAEQIGQGVSNREVAARLGISEHTARRHSEHLFTKLGVKRRAEIAALIAGLADQPPGTTPR